MNERFLDYFQTIFPDTEEFQEFITSLEKKIPRTIRIKPDRIDSVHFRLEKDGFILGTTPIKNVFTIDNTQVYSERESRIGMTLDHLMGNYYIQELAAATAVETLTGGNISHEPFLILDMASSPGGKTTQLAEMYPESFIIANEPSRDRIPQLLQNLSRMGTPNVGVTIYDGKFFGRVSEFFDKIVLDAPCSGEGTLFKGTDAVKHWHIKNIRKIAELQAKLLNSALIALKVGGEMIYSTCSMNQIENEGVLETLQKLYGDAIHIEYKKHFWPHRDMTGGFFVAKIRKISSLPTKKQEKSLQVNTDIHTYKGDLFRERLQNRYNLYEHKGKVLAVPAHIDIEAIKNTFYLIRLGETIGIETKERKHIDPQSIRYLKTDQFPAVILDDTLLDAYLRGISIQIPGDDEYICLKSKDGIVVALEKRSQNTVTCTLPQEFRRR